MIKKVLSGVVIAGVIGALTPMMANARVAPDAPGLATACQNASETATASAGLSRLCNG